MSIEWKEPPPPNPGGGARGPKRRSKWRAVADALRDNPGVWALIATTERPPTFSASASVLNAGRGFETTSRKVGPGQFDTYARYVGTAEDAS